MAEQKEKKQVTGLQLFNQTITSPATQAYLDKVLGERKASFVNNLTALVANESGLQACQPYTIMFAALKATALDLPLDKSLGYAFVIPYKDNKKGITVAQFQIGYKGLKQLAIRTGMFSILPVATEIKEGELVSRNRLTGECVFKFEEDDSKRAGLKTIGYASYFRLMNGAESVLYMSHEEMLAHAQRYSQTFRSSDPKIKNSSKWTTSFQDMALKTATKLNLSRNAPLSIEVQNAIRADQSVQFGEDEVEYIDNEEEQKILDAQKVQEVAGKFADFEEVKGGEETK